MCGIKGRTDLAWIETFRETCGKMLEITKRMRMSTEELRPKDEILGHPKLYVEEVSNEAKTD